MAANDGEAAGVPPAAPAAPTNTGPHLRLSAFWPTNPVAWFAMAEGQFIIRGVTDEAMRYYHVLPCLPKTTVNLVTDFMGGQLPDNPYTQLKARFLAAYQLTDYQREEQIFQLPPLGAQKPSELLAEMLRLCPWGQESSLFFTYLFLHRLPRELRVLLRDVDHNDRRLLSERADQLWAHYAKHSHSTMACLEAVSSDDEGGAREERLPPSAARAGAASTLAANLARRRGARYRWGGLRQPIASSSSLSGSSFPMGGCVGITTPSAIRLMPAGSRVRGPRKTSQPGSSCRHRPWQVSPRSR
jgi:hypothetical protein